MHQQILPVTTQSLLHSALDDSDNQLFGAEIRRRSDVFVELAQHDISAWPEQPALLLEILLNQDWPNLSAGLAVEYEGTRWPEYTGALGELSVALRCESLYRYAALALAGTRSSVALEILEKALAAKDPQSIAASAESYAWLGRSLAMHTKRADLMERCALRLLSMAKESQGSELGLLIAAQLVPLMNEDVLPLLLGDLEDPELSTRLAVVNLLKDLKVRAAVPRLLRILHDESDPHMLEALARAIAAAEGRKVGDHSREIQMLRLRERS